MPIRQCQVEAFDGYYLEYLVFYPIVIILQISLFCNSIYGECARTQRKQRRHSSLSKRIWFLAHSLYFLLQFIGIYWTLTDFTRFVLDPQYSIISHNYACNIAGYSPKLVPNLYYGLYLFQILLRLKHSFQGSYLAVRKCTFIVLSIFILVGNATFPVLVLLLNDTSPCLNPWHVLESNQKLFICGWPLSPNTTLIIIAGVVYVVLSNVILSVMFTAKLRRLSSGQRENEDAHFRTKSLIVKNCILTIIGAVSSVLSYCIWLLPLDIGAVFLHLDLFVNCLVIGLMFKYNERYYKRLCKCCIVMAFADCCKQQQNEEMRASTRTSLQQYFRNDIELDSIFTATHLHGNRVSAMDQIVSMTLDVDTNTIDYRDHDDDVDEEEKHVGHVHLHVDENHEMELPRRTTKDMENEILFGTRYATKGGSIPKKKVIRVE